MFFGALESHFTIVTISHVYVCMCVCKCIATKHLRAHAFALSFYSDEGHHIMFSNTFFSTHTYTRYAIRELPAPNSIAAQKYPCGRRARPATKRRVVCSSVLSMHNDNDNRLLLLALVVWRYIVFILYVYSCATRMIFYIYDI